MSKVIVIPYSRVLKERHDSLIWNISMDRLYWGQPSKWDTPQPGLCDNTVTEGDIVIDVALLQNLPILRWYWYCKNVVLDIVIDIGTAKAVFYLLILVLILQEPYSNLCYWYWYRIWKGSFTVIFIDIVYERIPYRYWYWYWTMLH